MYADGFAVARSSVDLMNAVAPTVRLVPGARIKGRVRYEDGSPGAYAKVHTGAPRSLGYRGTECEETGEFELRDLAAGRHTIFATLEDGRVEGEVEVAPGAVVEMEIVAR